MSELEIPDRAVCLADNQGGDSYLILQAAAPLVVAAELRRLSSTAQRENWPAFIRIILDHRADELDPQ